jgi:hypothetical protein
MATTAKIARSWTSEGSGPTIAAHGYAATFFWFGLVRGGIIFTLVWPLRGPEPGEAPAAVPSRAVPQTSRSVPPEEMLRTSVFWLLYLMFVLVFASGPLATAQDRARGARFRRREPRAAAGGLRPVGCARYR